MATIEQQENELNSKDTNNKMISPSTNIETLNVSVGENLNPADNPAAPADDDGSLDGGDDGSLLQQKLRPSIHAVSFSASTSSTSDANNSKDNKLDQSKREEAMMAASQILEKLDFLPEQEQTEDEEEEEEKEDEEEEEDEKLVDPAKAKARADAAAVLEALEFLPEKEPEEEEEDEKNEQQEEEEKGGETEGKEEEKNTTTTPTTKTTRSLSMTLGDILGGSSGRNAEEEAVPPPPELAERTTTLSSLADLNNNKEKYLQIVTRKVSTTEKVARDPTAGAKTAEEALLAWRRDMQITLENVDSKEGKAGYSHVTRGGLDMSVSAYGVRNDLAWDEWIEGGNNNNNNNDSTTKRSPKRQQSDGYRPHREALHKHRIYEVGHEPRQEWDFCDWLERSFTPPEKQTIEKMGYCRKEECIIL